MKRIVVVLFLSLGSSVFAAPAKVLLMPFESAGPAEKQWVAKALQENLLAELTRVNSVEAIAGKQTAADLNAALKAAADAKADYVIFGSYQAVEGDLRMTGQVVDVAKRQSVAGLKTTGTQRDLFGMEDTIARQVKHALPQPVAEAKPEMLHQPPAHPPVAVAPPAPEPEVDVNQRARELEAEIDRAIERLRYANNNDVYYPNSFSSGYYDPWYSYPYYGYGYGYGVVVNRRHHHFNNSGANFSGSFRNGSFTANFGGPTATRNFNTPQQANFIQARSANFNQVHR